MPYDATPLRWRCFSDPPIMTNTDPEAHLSNRLARRIFLQRQGLCAAPRSKQSKQDLLGQIRDLGFVQVDSVNTV